MPVFGKLHSISFACFGEGALIVWQLRTVAVLPGKAITMPWEDFRKICHDYTLLGLQTMVEARGESKAPFRFMYMSGAAAQRDQSKKPRIMPQYLLLRVSTLHESVTSKFLELLIANFDQGEIESRVLEYAAQHKGEVEVCVAKPGIILKPGYISQRIVAAALNLTGIVGNLSIKEVAAAMLQQVINGFEKEPLENEDLKRIGTAALKLT